MITIKLCQSCQARQALADAGGKHSIPPASMAAYLIGKGWRRRKVDRVSETWDGPSGSLRVPTFRRRPGFRERDYSDRIADVLAELSEVEDRTHMEIRKEMAATPPSPWSMASLSERERMAVREEIGYNGTAAISRYGNLVELFTSEQLGGRGSWQTVDPPLFREFERDCRRWRRDGRR